MSWVKDTFLGGAEKKAGRRVATAAREGADISAKAFEEVLNLYKQQLPTMMAMTQQQKGALNDLQQIYRPGSEPAPSASQLLASFNASQADPQIGPSAPPANYPGSSEYFNHLSSGGAR